MASNNTITVSNLLDGLYRVTVEYAPVQTREEAEQLRDEIRRRLGDTPRADTPPDLDAIAAYVVRYLRTVHGMEISPRVPKGMPPRQE